MELSLNLRMPLFLVAVWPEKAARLLSQEISWQRPLLRSKLCSELTWWRWVKY